MKLEDVGASVVSRHVEVILSLGYLAQIDIGEVYAFALVVRSCQDAAQRTHNHTAAADEHSLGRITLKRRIIGGIIPTAEELMYQRRSR
jgi:hypothetical protein